MAWDRYAYVSNNPVKFVDPSGHAQKCADGDLGGGCGSDGTQNYIWDKTEEKILKEIKEFLWANIPTGIAITTGVTNQNGFIGELGEGSTNLSVFNFYSGEYADLRSGGDFVYIGTPTLSSTQSFIGITYIYGATSMKSLLGPAINAGVTRSADAAIKVNLAYTRGMSMNSDGTPFKDPVSKKIVTTKEVDAGIGINIFPNVADYAFVIGMTDTRINGLFYQIPWWPKGQ